MKQHLRNLLKFKRKPPPASDLILPPELWLEILSGLEPRDIDALSLTCKRLRDISQPLLFHSIQAYPFSSACAVRNLDLNAYKRRSKQRIASLSSSRLSQLVRELSIVDFPTDAYFVEPFRQELFPLRDPIDEWFAAIPNFTNLEKLVCRGFPLSEERVKVIESLELNDLDLELRDYNGAQGVPEDTPMLLTCKRRLWIDRNLDRSDHYALQPIKPPRFRFHDSLEEIVSGEHTTECILNALSTSENQFTGLRHLQVDAGVACTSNLVDALRRCPLLVSIHLSFRPSAVRATLQDIPRDVVPNLLSYQGPLYLLPHFAKHHNIVVVRLCSQCLKNRNPGLDNNLGDVIPTLTQFAPHVSYLQLTVTKLSMEFFKSLHTLPSLMHLHVNSVSSFNIPSNAQTTPQAISLPFPKVTLPSQLKELRLGMPWFEGDELFVDALEKRMRFFPMNYVVSNYPDPRQVSDIVWTRNAEGKLESRAEHRVKRQDLFFAQIREGKERINKGLYLKGVDWPREISR